MDRRLLLIKLRHVIRESGMKDDRQFPEKVLAAEGPAILMWFLEEAQRGYQELVENGTFMGGTVDVGLELARKYRDKANPHTQWVKAEMNEDPAESTPARVCWHRYLDYGERVGMWRRQKRESYEEF
jgi:phage/plasmid-associated DNA primase